MDASQFEEGFYSLNCLQNKRHTSNCHGTQSRDSYTDMFMKNATNNLHSFPL